jgi:predicted deacetylase
MVNLPASRWLFGVGRRVQNRLDRWGLRQVRTERIIRGVKTAARTGQVIHLWAHPFEFRSNHDIDMLRAILRAVADERESGRLESVTMGDLAARIQAEGDYARLDA